MRNFSPESIFIISDALCLPKPRLQLSNTVLFVFLVIYHLQCFTLRSCFVRVEHIFFSIYRNIVCNIFILLPQKNQLCFVSFFRNYTVGTLFNLVYEIGCRFFILFTFFTQKSDYSFSPI